MRSFDASMRAMRHVVTAFAAMVLVACPAKTEKTKDPQKDTSATTKKAQEPAKPARDIEKAAEAETDTGGLARIKARGTLRVIVRRSEAAFLPRAGMPWLSDIENAEAFAEAIGAKPVFVLVESYDALIPALLDGKGDLVAAQLTVTDDRKKQVAFARSTLGVEEIVVGKKGAPNLPTKPEELGGREVVVRSSSSYAASLAALSKKKKVEVKIVEADEHLDTGAIVDIVTNGSGEQLTVVDSHLLAAFETYNDQIQRLFPLATKREISWAVRKSNSDLKAALDRFVIERAMTGHKAAKFTGDLDEIKKRGVLRMLTRNNAASYFLYRGEARGFDFALGKLIAKELDVRLEMVVAPDRAELIPWLLEGRGDLIAAQMTVTEDRKKRVAFSAPYLFTKEVLVKKKGAPGPSKVEELAGKKVHVRKSSSYRTSLEALQKTGVKVEIVDVPEDVETAVVLHQVADGEVPLTVADEHLLAIEQTYGVDVEAAFPLSEEETSIAWAVRPKDEKLKAFLDGFVKRKYRGLEYNVMKKRYFENERTITKFKAARVTNTKQLSPYDDLIKKYSKKYGFDWRLMAAQAYVESRFDPNAKSWVGAKGLFQVMPRTGASMGFKNLEDPETGIHAGIKYMSKLMKRFDPKLPFRQRMRMALAAYNAGLGHVYDARRLAKAEGMDQDRWFGNVEKAMLLLSDKKYAKKARHGYCRGREPVAYVSHIQSLYDQYVEVVAE